MQVLDELMRDVTEEKEGAMPRIIQLSPDGGGRYIAVDRDGDLWRGETKRQKDGGEEYIQWKPLASQFPSAMRSR